MKFGDLKIGSNFVSKSLEGAFVKTRPLLYESVNRIWSPHETLPTFNKKYMDVNAVNIVTGEPHYFEDTEEVR